MSLSKHTRRIVISKNTYKALLVIVILNCVIIYYKKKQNGLNIDSYSVQFEKVNGDMSCHYLENEDVLPSASEIEFSPKPNSIFFHETSCRGSLTARQACSIESAAKTNPQSEIYVLFSSPVTEFVLMNSSLAQLKSLPNLRFARVHITKYAKGTPLEDTIKKMPLQESKWWIEHTSDVLRCLTLYKWGGVYLDTDMIVAKSLTALGNNWVALENNDLVNSAAIAISTDAIGRRLAAALINELNNTYRPDIWIHNGPGAITRVLSQFCKTQVPSKWSSSSCDGLEVYSREYFYPVHYTRSKVYFQPGELTEIENSAYAFHLWNKITSHMQIETGSPFMKMAKKFCPTIFQKYGDSFGKN